MVIHSLLSRLECSDLNEICRFTIERMSVLIQNINHLITLPCVHKALKKKSNFILFKQFIITR